MSVSKRRLIWVCTIIAILVAVIWPAFHAARKAFVRSHCKSFYKQIGIALHNYHEINGCFPPAYIADASGRPMHSWRVLLLPHIDHQALYNRYNFGEPWDGPNNIKLLPEMPIIFACPEHHRPGGTNTTYLAVVGPNAAFQGATPVRIKDMTDGASNTAMVGETTGPGVPWLKPEDVDITLHPSLGDPAGFGSRHKGPGAHFLFGDGAVRFVPYDTPAHRLKAAFTINGDEAANFEF